MTNVSFGSLTQLALCIIYSEPEERRPLTPQQRDFTRDQIQLEDGGVHILRPEDGILVLSDPKRVIKFSATVHNLDCKRKLPYTLPYSDNCGSK